MSGDEKQNAAIRELEHGCYLYCRWFDTGKPSMDGSGMAYELVTFMRIALMKLKPEQERRDE
jgi:hypothetical protein